MPGRNGCIQALILASALTLCERPLSARMKDLELRRPAVRLMACNVDASNYGPRACRYAA